MFRILMLIIMMLFPKICHALDEYVEKYDKPLIVYLEKHEVNIDNMLLYFSQYKGMPLDPENKYEDAVVMANFTIRPHGELLLCMALVESFGNLLLVRGEAYGLLQVSKVHTQQDEINRLESHPTRDSILSVCGIHNKEELLDVHKNICAGAYLFEIYYRENDADVVKALEKYNASSNKVTYAKKVMQVYEEFLKLSNRPNRYKNYN